MDRDIKAFLAVARDGNLTAAADKIGLTQPALTKTIKRLEDRVGARLFDRSARGMILNEMGAMFLVRARAIETHWSQACEELDARTTGHLREFRIAAGANYHMRIAPQLVYQLAEEFPQTQFALDFDIAGGMIGPLQQGDIHLLVGAFDRQPLEGLITEHLMDVVTQVVCCRNNPLTRLKRVPPLALEGQRWLIYTRDSLMRQRLEAFCLRNQLMPPKIVIEIDAMASGMAITRGTDLLIPAPTALKSVAEDAGLAMLPLKVPLWTFPSGVWLRSATREYPIMRRALELLRHHCK